MEEHLKDQYGYNSFRSLQKEAIETTLNKTDSIVLFPTGGGKSICYQFPATYLKGLTVVISPLISLMNDQYHNLKQANIKALVLNGETTEIIMSIPEDCRILYLTPEYLVNNETIIDMLQAADVTLFAIDEAHCLSEWGHDFRPTYQKLKIIKEKFENVPVSAFTATATPHVIEDIKKSLNMSNPVIIKKDTYRSNLKLSIHKKTDLETDLTPFLQDSTISTIIYVQTRDMTDKIFKFIKHKFENLNVERYHAAMSKAEKASSHDKFLKNKINVMVATIAFGMGIDKPDIRQVILYGASMDIETYYQEVGRAGRDGISAIGVMFYSSSDFVTSQFIFSKSQNAKHRLLLLNKFKEFIKSSKCRQYIIDYYFKTGELPVIQEEVKECSCDNCQANTSDLLITDLTRETELLYSIIKSLPCNYGSAKLSKMIFEKDNSHSLEWYKAFIDLLLSFKLLLNKTFNDKYNLIIMPVILQTKVLLPVPIEMQLLSSTIDKSYLKKLKDTRLLIAQRENIAQYNVIGESVLLNIALAKPRSSEELFKVNGISKSFKYVDDFLYKQDKKIEQLNLKLNSTLTLNSNLTLNSTLTLKPCSPSSLISYNMFKEGQTVDEIAQSRNLKSATIESHLNDIWIANGTLQNDIAFLNITDEMITEVKKAKSLQKEDEPVKLKPIKEIVKEITYLQIKAILSIKD